MPPLGEGTPEAVAEAHAGPRRATSLSPNQRAWARFKRNRLGYVSLFVFIAMLVVGVFFRNDVLQLPIASSDIVFLKFFYVIGGLKI
jgi:hypothetical protein